MRTIEKQIEPPCLAELRREANRVRRETGKPPVAKDWNPAQCVHALRQALHDDQGGLCAYCMGRIKPHGYRSELHELGGMKIEHWVDRSSKPERMYDWDNLLGVCGGEFRGPDGLVEHCDTSRKDEPLHVNPGTISPPRPEDVFEFSARPPEPSRRASLPRGLWIHPRDQDSAAAHDIAALNLNADHLARNRHATLEQLRLALRIRGRDEQALRNILRRRLRTATRPGPSGLPPFAPLIADYVRKKMRAKGIDP